MRTCACGGDIYIKKTEECKRCYMRRYMEGYAPKRRYGIDKCQCGKDKSRGATLCADCYRAEQRANALTEEERRAKATAKAREYRSRPGVKERLNQQRNERRKRNGREADKNKKARKQKRRALEYAALRYPLPNNYYNVLMYMYGSRCLKCGATEDLHLDHIIPISKGGTHTWCNWQPLCAKHNQQKATQIMDYRPEEMRKRIELVESFRGSFNFEVRQVRPTSFKQKRTETFGGFKD